VGAGAAARPAASILEHHQRADSSYISGIVLPILGGETIGG
jgi:hypothetical protein